MVIDWNNDSRKDLIIGNENYEVRVYLNSGTNAAPVFTNYTVAITNTNTLMRNSPEVYDLNRDGKKDVIAGDEFGYVYFYENIGTDAAPVFNNTADTLKLDNGLPLLVPSRAHIDLVDWDENGSKDLIVGDNDGYIHLFVNPSGDALDPEHPTNVAAYSDYTTPSSMTLTWSDPSALYNGTPISPPDFTVEIERDNIWIASIPGGVEQYLDAGLNDGQYYQYSLRSKLVSNDSTSMPAVVYRHAGGSPMPAAPTSLSGVGSLTQASLSWTDPTTQDDGTPLDDLDSIFVYRNGMKIASLEPGIQTYIDIPSIGYSYRYYVTAVDNEIPPNESQPSNQASVFVGETPGFLVWVGPDVLSTSAASGDSIFQSLVDNGESTFLTDDLFEFGTNLGIYDAIFVVLGVFANNHVLAASDPEGPALESYLQNGGRLYLEGADCFAFDPGVGGYNINPWFSCNPVSDGSGDVSGVLGLNNLSAFTFTYNGENNYMDELGAINSLEIWQNNQNTDIHGLFNPVFGEGKAIGVVPSFGGMMNSLDALNETLQTAQNISEKKPDRPDVRREIRPKNHDRKPFTKRYGYIPENKINRKVLTELVEFSAGGVKILANNKDDLMAAYLGLLGFANTPVLSLSHTTFHDTLTQGDTCQDTLTVSNAGNPMAPNLVFTITENPEVDWLSFTPANDTLAGGGAVDITILMDATGLSIGSYLTRLMIASNDPTCPLDSVSMHLEVTEPQDIAEGDVTLPRRFDLLQNYPNPFNPSTLIRYQLPYTADVQLEIYSVLGQKIRSLINSQVLAGHHQVEWDGFDDMGLPVASGIYLCHMKAGPFSRSYKMVLLR